MTGVESELRDVLSRLIPIIIIFFIAIVGTTALQEWVRGWWRKNRGNRRDDVRNEWPAQLIDSIRKIETSTQELNCFVKNGFSHDIKSISRNISELKELYKINSELINELRRLLSTK